MKLHQSSARLLVVFFVFLSGVTSVRGQTSSDATGRVVYVLAGQSNMAELWTLTGTTCGQTATLPSNLTFWEPTFTPTLHAVTTVPAATTPVRTLGEQLALAHAPRQVDILMVAQSGSSLLRRNAPFTSGSGSWINEAVPTDITAWAHFGGYVASTLNLNAADELHIVWGQGESDCINGQTTTVAEYSFWSQFVFAVFAAYTNKLTYDVHLVTVGALYDPNWSNGVVNNIRDAFFEMPSNVIVFPGFLPTIRTAAHHYDLDRRTDGVHLTHCASVELADRIADGILQPLQLPRGTGTTSVSSTDIKIATNVNLVTVPLGQASNKFFEVTVGGTTLSPSDFEISASGSSLTIHVPTGGVTPTNFTVRHVAGPGIGLDWATMPTFTDTVLFAPLEPFHLP
ncbi:MAG: hypothetical protein L6Q99_04370 [Planctomycetes bacterium]|nr:hypothetical protein [Planctomycetota bacterium]